MKTAFSELMRTKVYRIPLDRFLGSPFIFPLTFSTEKPCNLVLGGFIFQHTLDSSRKCKSHSLKADMWSQFALSTDADPDISPSA